ncbi:MAG TPA: hypothetical protein VFL47_07835, partial [Flavisolibacter sp.]|nr:hypothetical protein [Flavisolibacter sp.]
IVVFIFVYRLLLSLRNTGLQTKTGKLGKTKASSSSCVVFLQQFFGEIVVNECVCSRNEA